jgi:hypothetical protein
VSAGEAEMAEVSQEATNNADDAISVLAALGSKEELLLAFSLASIQDWYIANISKLEVERKRTADKSLSYAESALSLSNEVENPYCKAMSWWAGVFSSLYFTENIELALQYSKEMLKQASLVRDNYLKGIALYLTAHVLDWKVLGEANPSKRKQQFEEIIKFSAESIKLLELVFQDSFIADTYLFPAQAYSAIASDYAVSPSEKLVYSRKAVEIGKKGLEHAIRSGAPEAMISKLDGLSKAYYFQSNLEPRKDDKVELLRNALGFRKEYITTAQNSLPSNLWVLGVGLVYSAKIEIDLSRLEESENRVSLLKEAIVDMTEGVTLCKTWITSRPVPSVIASLAGFEDTFGGILDEAYKLTSDIDNLTKANEIYKEAAEDFKRVDLPSRVAESYWKIANNLDCVSEFDRANGIPIAATRTFGYTFSGWDVQADSITVADTTSLSTTITVNGPGTLTANFILNSGQATVPTGDDVEVFPSQNVGLTFGTVNIGGDATAFTTSIYDVIPPPLDGSFVGDIWDIKTTADFSGTIVVGVVIESNSWPVGLRLWQVDFLLGDVNFDGAVNSTDVALINHAYGSYPGSPEWNPLFDLNGDNVIDSLDVTICNHNYGMTSAWTDITIPNSIVQLNATHYVIYGATDHFSGFGVHR